MTNFEFSFLLFPFFYWPLYGIYLLKSFNFMIFSSFVFWKWAQFLKSYLNPFLFAICFLHKSGRWFPTEEKQKIWFVSLRVLVCPGKWNIEVFSQLQYLCKPFKFRLIHENWVQEKTYFFHRLIHWELCK